ncbi:methionyl-tRNA formyltransferase [Zobellia amurskyensis]|uniref:Methionyl-tRNA formyltransferase n=1 Tax=Zobellia amurskyensis TaxID=248905 RepID=A0A7X3D2B9_9FLAO|nr:methionyl-tRNA formyltransferase [Zobellia amurskyensis]MUH36961.1 methionyl-tRNA formyltransferase [Zobellia amurskyensis]
MKDLRIVFMGTPEFATTILAALVEHSYNVVGIITAPDRPAGRGRSLQQSHVKKYALENGLKVLQPTNLKNEDFLSELKSLNGNLQIVVAFRMLPKAVWAMPEYGTFNLHASLLPDYRGAAPINWAIINGETETGVTTFFIDDKIDTGEIILQDRTDIGENMSAGELHDKLMVMGANLVVSTVKAIAKGPVKTIAQPTSKKLKEAYKIHKDTCEIDWTKSIDKVFNHIRGLSPYPGAWTTLMNGEEKIFVKIYDTAKENTDHKLNVGEIETSKKELKVGVDGGYINVLEMQLPGKRKMKIQDVLNGLNLQKNAKMS